MAIVILSLPEEPLPPLINPATGGSVRLFVELVDNAGKRYSIETVKRVVAKYFEGATITRSEGLWRQRKKQWAPSVIVTILNHPPIAWRKFSGNVERLVDELIRKLRQEEILVDALPPR